MNKNFLAIKAWNYPSKKSDIRLDLLITSKEGNIHLDFRNSLLKYARNKRRHKFIFTGITVDYQPVKENFFYYNLGNRH